MAEPCCVRSMRSLAALAQALLTQEHVWRKRSALSTALGPPDTALLPVARHRCAGSVAKKCGWHHSGTACGIGAQ